MFSPKQQSATDFRTSCASNNCFPGKNVSHSSCWIKTHSICFCICNYLCIWGQGDESTTLIEVKEMRVSSYLRSSKWEYHPIWGQGNKSTILFEVKEMRVPPYLRSRKGGTESIVPIGVTRLGGPDSRASLWQNWSVSEGSERIKNVVFDRKANKPWL